MIARLALVMILLAGPALACAQPEDLTGLRAALLVAVNDARDRSGQPPVAGESRLDAAAQAQACRLARRGATRLSHRGSWFAGLQRRLRREDYPYAVAVENLAAGQRDVAEVVEAWRASPDHRVNLLEPRVAEVGFGVALAESGWLYWSMVGAARRAGE